MVQIEIGGRRVGFDISPAEHALFLTIGMALVQIQNFESILGQIVSVLAMSPDSDISLEELEVALSAYDGKTLGRIIKTMEKHFNDSELVSELEGVREKRNFIVHHSLRAYPDISDKECIDLLLDVEHSIVEICAVQDKLIRVLRDQNVIDVGEVTIDCETGQIFDD